MKIGTNIRRNAFELIGRLGNDVGLVSDVDDVWGASYGFIMSHSLQSRCVPWQITLAITQSQPENYDSKSRPTGDLRASLGSVAFDPLDVFSP